MGLLRSWADSWDEIIMGIKGGAVLVWEQYIGNYRNREHWAVFAQVFDQFGNRKMRMDKVLSNQLPCQIEQSYGTFEVTNCFHRDAPCNNVSYLLTNDCPYSSPNPIVNYIEEGFSIILETIQSQNSPFRFSA